MARCRPFTLDPSLEPELRGAPAFESAGGLPTLPPDWTERSDVRGAWMALRTFGAFALLLGAAPWAVSAFSPWVLVPWLTLLGAYVHKITIVMHECSHNTLFATRHWNERVGAFGGLLVGSDFRVYARDHMQHHRYNGTERDPQLRPVALLHGTSRRRRLAYLLRPLCGWTLLDVYREYVRGADRSAADVASVEGLARAQERRSRAWLLAGIVVVQGGVALLATGFGTQPWLVLLFPAAAGLFGLFFSRLRGYCEHIAPASWSHGIFTRTHRAPLLERIFLHGLHMNYHLEHHLYPGVACHRLPELHALLAEGYHTPLTCSPSMTSTVIRSLREASR